MKYLLTTLLSVFVLASLQAQTPDTVKVYFPDLSPFATNTKVQADSTTLSAATNLKANISDTLNQVRTPYYKKWVLFGDSFSATTSRYYGRVDSILNMTGTVTQAVSGAMISAQSAKMDSILAATPTYFQNFNIASILIGVNDWTGATYPLGTRNDTAGQVSFAGYLKHMIQSILISNPKIELFVMTPTETTTSHGFHGVNSLGWNLDDLAALESEICSYYGVQCIDLHSMVDFNNQTLSTLTDDNLHPNYEGSKVLARIIAHAFINSNNKGNKSPFSYKNGNYGLESLIPQAKMDIPGSIVTSNASIYHYKSVATYYNGSPSLTGTMKIMMPNGWSDNLLSIEINGFNISTLSTWKVFVSGNNHSSPASWAFYSARIVGSAPFTSVRLAYDSVNSKCVILLGTTSTIWSIPAAEISDVIVNEGVLTGWGTGWNISVIPSETNIATTKTVTPKLSMYETAGGNILFNTTNDDGKGKVQVNGRVTYSVDPLMDNSDSLVHADKKYVDAQNATRYSGLIGTNYIPYVSAPYTLAQSPLFIGSGNVFYGTTFALVGSNVENDGAFRARTQFTGMYFDDAFQTIRFFANGGNAFKYWSDGTLRYYVHPSVSASTLVIPDMYIIDSALLGKVDTSSMSFINVKSKGAIGDGVTVDTLAFQKAISIARATGKSIYVPAGNYNLPFTQSVELAGIPRFFGDNDTLNFSNMVKLNGVPIDSVTYPANTSNAVFTNTGTISLIQSGVNMTKDSVGVVLSTSAGVKPGDILFFTSVTPSPFPQFSYYFSGQRATVDSFNTLTGMCYLHEKVFYNISNAYVWKNSYRPNIDFGEGCTLLAKQYNTIIGIKAVNSSLNAYGTYKYWGKAAISYTNSTGNATVNTYENYRPNNGNSYGISIADLSTVTVLNSNIKGGRACVASGGGDYWLANQSGGSTGFAAYPCTINVVGGTLAPNQREGYASIDAHGITRSMFISGNTILYAPLYTQAENVIANGFTIYSNGLSAINLANKDSTVGVYNFSNFTIYSKATGVPGAIALNGGINSLSISNGDIIDSSTNGSVSIVFPYFKCDIDNLRVTELAGTPFYLNFYNNNAIINGLNITGGTFTPVAKNDSLTLIINNSSFNNVPQTGTFQNGISGLQAKLMKNVTLNNVTATGNAKFGVDVGNNVLEVHVNGGRYADNGKGLTGATNQAGIRAFNVQNFWVNNVDFRSYIGTQAYGIEHYGYSTPAYLNVTNSNFKGNTTAAFFQSSSTINGILNDIDIDGSLMNSTFGSSIVKINTDTVATRAYSRTVGGTGSGGTLTNPITFNNSGTGASSPTTADGSTAKTISYNTLGAVPTTTMVNGHVLSGNISVTFPDIVAGAIANNTTATTQATTDSSNKLETTAGVKQLISNSTQSTVVGAGLADASTGTNSDSLFLKERIATTTSASTITINLDTTSMYTVTALAAGVTFANPTSIYTQNGGRHLIIRIKDNGASQTLSFGNQFRGSTDVPLPTATTLGKTMYLEFIWNSVDNKWDLLIKNNGF